ncbi:MAG TPA: GNAT family N-acetyltransferase [Planctomycetota bacterium]|nr:GNAT family N-acetyltransferase [Planctomycetota bacterium]HRR82024.1 GNAT family N-acetyltransferase [Planctomycetota bacterium]HRT93558.1 GNAT family N-acetyltransferase [Planctomycetota bacterium]
MPTRRLAPSSCEIRGPATRREILALADLYGKAFGRYQPLYDSFLDKHFRQMPREQWRLARALWAPDGSPVAMVRVCDRTMRLGAALVRVAGIGDVCTLPGLRKHGLMRTLFAHVNQFMHDEGYDLSLLFGIPNFYDKFGFAVGAWNAWVQLPRAQAARLSGSYKGRRARRADLAAIRRLHADDLAIRDGAMERWGDAWLQQALREKLCRVLADPKGRARAYYRARAEGDALILTEVSLGRKPDLDGVRSVLADMAKVAKACEKPNLRLELDPAHPIGRFCIADGCETRSWIGHRGGSMVRIANLENLCRHMAPEWERLLAASPAAGWSGRLRLKTDIGTVDLAIARGKVSIVGGASAPVGGVSPPRDPALATITATQDRLCRLVVGFHTPAAAVFLGEVRISPAARPLADALFPARSLVFFPYDRF